MNAPARSAIAIAITIAETDGHLGGAAEKQGRAAQTLGTFREFPSKLANARKTLRKIRPISHKNFAGALLIALEKADKWAKLMYT